MDSERLWVLMNQQLDGKNSRAEEQDLREELERSVEARHLMGELRELNRELGSVKAVELSADLTSQHNEGCSRQEARVAEGGRDPFRRFANTTGDLPAVALPTGSGTADGAAHWCSLEGHFSRERSG